MPEELSMTQPPPNNKDDVAAPLDNVPYTMKSIFAGSYCRENMKDYRDQKTKPLSLPFEDKETWKLLTETLSIKQPDIARRKDSNEYSNEYPKELKYLTSLFQTLGNHKANKFCRWLHNIRSLGTSGAPAPMDITAIGKKITLSAHENGEQIYKTFFNKTLPFMRDLILSMRTTFNANTETDKKDDDNDNDTDNKTNTEPMSFMNPGCNAQFEMTRGQIASILACCFFGIPLYEHCSFQVELSSVGTPGKLECWVRYFDFVRQKTMDSDWFNKEKVTVWRRCLDAKECSCLEYKSLVHNETVLCDFVVSEEGCIEDQSGQLHADFANQYIGGGVLEGGNVQEEIRFTVNVECVISKWLCPLPMRHNEAIIILGSQQFFDYSGYGSRFSFNGYRNNETEMFFCEDKKDRLGSSVIVGIDALYLWAPKSQIETNFMMREIAKSFVGYSISNQNIGHKMDVVSTGNWGCGIFRGDPQLKAMLQWISITLSNRSVAYYTFNDRRVANGQLTEFIKDFSAKQITIGSIWKVLTNTDIQQRYKDGCPLIDLLRAEYKCISSQTTNDEEPTQKKQKVDASAV
eukprot:250122_1